MINSAVRGFSWAQAMTKAKANLKTAVNKVRMQPHQAEKLWHGIRRED
jgi:hypothetical protein